MPEGRPIDPIPILGAAMIGGGIAWILLKRRKTKFIVGQRVALVFQPQTEGTVIQVQPLGSDGVQTYVVQFDNIAGPSIVAEADLIAI